MTLCFVPNNDLPVTLVLANGTSAATAASTSRSGSRSASHPSSFVRHSVESQPELMDMDMGNAALTPSVSRSASIKEDALSGSGFMRGRCVEVWCARVTLCYILSLARFSVCVFERASV